MRLGVNSMVTLSSFLKLDKSDTNQQRGKKKKKLHNFYPKFNIYYIQL